MTGTLTSLADWDNFYVIVGSSAAGLTGLTFVIVALASDARAVRLSGLRVFMTPMVVHFCSAIWLAVLLCVPGHTALSLGIATGLSGVVGDWYSIRNVHRLTHTLEDYKPVAEDWIWTGWLPVIVYLLLIVAGVAAPFAHVTLALYLIGASALSLLFIGIHNAWDLAVWLTAERPEAQRRAAGAAGSDTADAPPEHDSGN